MTSGGAFNDTGQGRAPAELGMRHRYSVVPPVSVALPGFAIHLIRLTRKLEAEIRFSHLPNAWIGPSNESGADAPGDDCATDC